MDYFRILISFAFAYLVGCFNTSYYYVKLRYNLDIRNLGSKNAGATNVGRIYGKLGFVICFLGDIIKAFSVFFIAKEIQLPEGVLQISLMLTILGHIFPFQLGFKGGKGVATTLAMLMMLDYHIVILLFLNFILIYVVVKKYQLSGLLAFLAIVVEYPFIKDFNHTFVFILFSVAILLYCHKNNISKQLKSIFKE